MQGAQSWKLPQGSSMRWSRRRGAELLKAHAMRGSRPPGHAPRRLATESDDGDAARHLSARRQHHPMPWHAFGTLPEKTFAEQARSHKPERPDGRSIPGCDDREKAAADARRAGRHHSSCSTASKSWQTARRRPRRSNRANRRRTPPRRIAARLPRPAAERHEPQRSDAAADRAQGERRSCARGEGDSGPGRASDDPRDTPRVQPAHLRR